jgi:hypothetical protein
VNGEQNRVLFTPLFTGKHLYIQQLASDPFTPFGHCERGEQNGVFVHPLVNAYSAAFRPRSVRLHLPRTTSTSFSDLSF